VQGCLRPFDWLILAARIRKIALQDPFFSGLLVEQIASTDTFKGGHRKSPAELKQNYRIAENRLQNLRGIVGIFDDVLTTGSHFKAIKEMILERAPQARVIGFFVARRAIPNPFEELSEDDLLKL
jgi:predicted amidophosphoribosyltransferase